MECLSTKSSQVKSLNRVFFILGISNSYFKWDAVLLSNKSTIASDYIFPNIPKTLLYDFLAAKYSIKVVINSSDLFKNMWGNIW